MMNNAIQELKNAIEKKQVLLFVGSGISSSVGLPSWNALIARLVKQLGIDSELLEMLGDNLSLAEYYSIQSDKQGEYEVSPMEFLCNIVKDSEKNNRNKIETSTVHQSIVDLGCPIIYTTNYDHCLEIAYDHFGKPYHTISSVADIANLPSDTTQIIKIHGDYNNPQDIVFTESSYFDRLDFESPLDIKLRGDMLSKTILFIGYSLSDVNIRLLIYKLDKIWKRSGVDTDLNLTIRPKSYIFMAQPNYIQEAILKERGIVPIIGRSIDPQVSTEEFLRSIKPSI